MNPNIRSTIISFTAAAPGYVVAFTDEFETWELPMIGYTLTEHSWIGGNPYDDGDEPWRNLNPTILEEDGPETVREYMAERDRSIKWRIQGPGL